MEKMYLSLVIGMISWLVLFGCVNAFTHIVGGNHGWRVPDSVSFFDQWAKPRTFGVGDRLVFPYRPGANNVMEVNKQDYGACGQDAVLHMYFLGPTILNLTKPGDYYYYDGIGKHCEAGQKLHIKVGTKEGSSGSDPMPFNLETFGIPLFSSSNNPSAGSPALPKAKASSSATPASTPTTPSAS